MFSASQRQRDSPRSLAFAKVSRKIVKTANAACLVRPAGAIAARTVRRSGGRGARPSAGGCPSDFLHLAGGTL
eukprot:jgi/Tetstr1/425447/TSEL_015894.t1